MIKRFIDSNVGCIATDRITVDGCKVGFMYREEPLDGQPDSGWRFMAGDESEEYMGNPDNHSVYQVNTICNYDEDIIPLLHAAPGTNVLPFISCIKAPTSLNPISLYTLIVF
ncbi:DUF2185 domain-containing protein [Oceanobacillus bengalensis]|uniref:DUF2185 domain-containing protein n=2 Tax=Oceanobacillus bengalensis TaxID=1435466 RepID=A0A494YS69_9BACI|nr:DUF2185 domain-containing protein [Oceanobacillus bengalensis]